MIKVPTNQRQAFTLVELLVGMVILTIMVVLCANIISGTSTAWKRADQKANAFQSARLAFESMTLALSQATLNPYWDYVDTTKSPPQRRTEANKTTFTPTSYQRSSDLHFLITPVPTPPPTANPPTFTSLSTSPPGSDAMFFQVPSGYSSDTTLRPLGNLLNSVGFFIQFGNDQAWRPPFITADKNRYRLMQLFQPSADNHVYSTYDWSSSGSESSTRWKWIIDALATPATIHPLADNIIALVIIPRDPTNVALSDNYFYDSRAAGTTTTPPPSYNQLPPFVEIVMVAIDETSALRLDKQLNGVAPDFGTATLFTKVDKLDQDISTLEGTLQGMRIDYRVFRTTVRIDSSRWSKN